MSIVRLLIWFAVAAAVTGFSPLKGSRNRNLMTSSAATHHPFCDLPGDPSLILTTNVDLGDKKMEIMKSISKAMSLHTGKPESYIGESTTIIGIGSIELINEPPLQLSPSPTRRT